MELQDRRRVLVEHHNRDTHSPILAVEEEAGPRHSRGNPRTPSALRLREQAMAEPDR
ncbi:MAG: hypothetical protein ACFCVA_06540 [Gammaproteobacteria bacterium]